MDNLGIDTADGIEGADNPDKDIGVTDKRVDDLSIGIVNRNRRADNLDTGTGAVNRGADNLGISIANTDADKRAKNLNSGITDANKADKSSIDVDKKADGQTDATNKTRAFLFFL